MKTFVEATGDLDTAINESRIIADVTGCDYASIQLDLYEDAVVSTCTAVVSNNGNVWYAAKAVDPTTGTATAITITQPGILRMIQVTDVKYIGVQAPSSGGGGTFKVTIRATSAN